MKMIEFGSDFHYCDTGCASQGHLMDLYHDAVLLADGRQCIVALIEQYGWNRIWMPAYFCYNIIEYLQKNTKTEVVLYTDYPGNDDEQAISNLTFRDGDVLFRMNYFGLRAFRNEKPVPIPVIEDHTHDLAGDWARNSDADWCIASLRKIIPIPEGGIVWSPKGHVLDCQLKPSSFNNNLAGKRWLAMEEKGRYLIGEDCDKDSFRRLYIETEEAFDEPGISSIDDRSKDYLSTFDLHAWNIAKRKNWELLADSLSGSSIKVLYPEKDDLVPLSLILLFKDRQQRDRVRKELIASSVYPAVLWNVPDNVHKDVRDFSGRMLSVHCDGRYSESEMKVLYNTICNIIRND